MEKNYYDLLIIKIKNLLSENKKEEALKLVNEELSLPYVPRKYEDQLLKFKGELDVKEENKKRQMFSRDELLVIISEHEKSDNEFLLSIASTFGEFNWKNYEKKIQDIFDLEKLDNKIKAMIYNELVVQEFDYDFKVNDLVINPHINKTMFETEFALLNLKRISKYDFDNPSLLGISEQIFFIYLMNNFPKSLFFKSEDIVSNIISVANVMLGEKDASSLSKEEKNFYNNVIGKE